MLSTIVQSALKQRIVITVFALIGLAFGIQATRKLSVDAFPDVTNIQVQVATEVPGRSPDEVERMVTVPVEIGMTGLPSMTITSMVGLSVPHEPVFCGYVLLDCPLQSPGSVASARPVL